MDNNGDEGTKQQQQQHKRNNIQTSKDGRSCDAEDVKNDYIVELL